MSHQLSGGLRRRVQLARSLVCGANVIFLDEPTTGLDPHSKRRTWDFVKDAKKAGKTVFLTTQSMEEAEILCDKLCFMSFGQALEISNMDALRGSYGSLCAQVKLGKLSAQQETDLENLSLESDVSNPIQYDKPNNLLETKGLLNVSKLISYLEHNAYPVISFSVNDLSLEEIYLKIMEGRAC